MAPALAQEAQEQPVPAQCIIAQSGKAQEADWDIVTADQTSVDGVRLDSLVADTLYVSKRLSRFEWAGGKDRRIQALQISTITSIRYSPPSVALWYGIGGGVLASIFHGTLTYAASGGREQPNYSAPAGWGILFGLIGLVKDISSRDSYDLTKKTTAEKGLLITDLLVSGASSRK